MGGLFFSLIVRGMKRDLRGDGMNKMQTDTNTEKIRGRRMGRKTENGGVDENDKIKKIGKKTGMTE